jgi:hypothetical protein
MSDEILTESQKRFLRVTLTLLEKAMRQIKVQSFCAPEVFELYVIENTIPQHHRKPLCEKADEALAAIEQLKAKFHLEQSRKDVRREIWAQLAGAWENLQAIQSKGLRNYGEISPQLPDQLDPLLERLVE